MNRDRLPAGVLQRRTDQEPPQDYHISRRTGFELAAGETLPPIHGLFPYGVETSESSEQLEKSSTAEDQEGADHWLPTARGRTHSDGSSQHKRFDGLWNGLTKCGGSGGKRDATSSSYSSRDCRVSRGSDSKGLLFDGVEDKTGHRAGSIVNDRHAPSRRTVGWLRGALSKATSKLCFASGKNDIHL